MTCPYCNGRRKPCEMCAGRRQIVGPARDANEQARCETIGRMVGPPPQSVPSAAPSGTVRA